MPVLSLACHLPHNTPHIPSRCNNEQTPKQTKAINDSYIYINISCKCDTNRAGHFTLDAYASRPVACIIYVDYHTQGMYTWNRRHHDDVLKWKHFPRYWPFARGIHRLPVNSLHKDQWRGALMFSFICAWIIGWVNNREAGDLKHQRAHYDVIAMLILMARQLKFVFYVNSIPWNLASFRDGFSIKTIPSPLHRSVP